MMEDDDLGERGRPQRRTQGRRLSDKVEVIFDDACAQGDFEIAAKLLDLLEVMLMRRPVMIGPERRKGMINLVASHEKLWQLRMQKKP